MIHIISLLTALSVTLALTSQPQEQQSPEDFSVNLLTRVKDMTITSPGSQTPIHWANATTHQVYNDAREGDVNYSVIGHLTFSDERSFQVYHIETSQWDADVGPFVWFWPRADFLHRSQSRFGSVATCPTLISPFQKRIPAEQV